MIRYLENKHIDYAKWDDCIALASNRLIYAFSWYLDVVCVEWDALVLDDYQAVMPLPKKKKWGIQYIYQPFFCQQLGVFSPSDTFPLVDDFLAAIPSHFRYVDQNLNVANGIPLSCYQENVNYELALSSLEKMEESFSTNTKRNIKKADKLNVQLINQIPPEEHLKLFKDQIQLDALKEVDYQRFLRLLYLLVYKGIGNIYGIYGEGNQLLATGAILCDNQRLTYLNGAASKEGKKSGSMYWFFQKIFIENEGKVFDFEGSNIAGVARFYKGFGAKKTMYASIKLNRLPRVLRWLK